MGEEANLAFGFWNMKIKILRYPHGYIGGIYDADICPCITTSDFANNNFIIEYETEINTDTLPSKDT